jgi:hypothetical protein
MILAPSYGQRDYGAMRPPRWKERCTNYHDNAGPDVHGGACAAAEGKGESNTVIGRADGERLSATTLPLIGITRNRSVCYASASI